MNMKKLATILLLIGMALQAYCQSNDELAAKANKAYQAGQYAVAIELYEKIIGSGYESAPLYYNLGNAYFRSKEIPSAILFYEKALKQDPNQSDIRHNLSVANSRITDKVEIIPELFYKRWWKALLNLVSLDSLAVVLILLLCGALISAGFYLASRQLYIRKTAFWSTLALAAFFLLAFAAVRQKEHLLQNFHEAIVFSPTVTVKSSPDTASADIFVIHEGLKVFLLDQIGEWQEIRIANGSIGWLKASDIRMI